MKYKDLFEYSDEYNRNEIKKNNYDIEPMYDISIIHGKRLSSMFNVDKSVVLIALALMDSKLPEAVRKGNIKEHVELSHAAAKEILDKVDDITDEKRTNILKCIEEHHGRNEYYSLESELVANIDCYKFLSIKGIMTYFSILGRRHNDLEKELTQLEFKMDEKFEHLSLDIAKEELTANYEQFKKHIKDCREDK